MKGSRIAIVMAGVVALHLAVAGVMVMTGGCTSKPEVLQNRPYIPAPTMQPAVTEPMAPFPELGPGVTNLPVPEIVAEPELLTHTVKSGDSYWKIARQYGVSHQELAAFNQADLSKPLRVGSTLRIPPGGAIIPADQLPPIKSSTATATATATKGTTPSGIKAQAPPPGGSYTVQKGDSLWLIARKFGTTTKDIAAANNMGVEKPIQVGQKLTIPGSKGAPAAKSTPAPTPATSPSLDDLYAPLPGSTPSATPGTTPAAPAATPSNTETDKMIDDLLKADGQSFSEHQVLPGENLQSVADLYGMKVEDLRKANPAVPADGKLAPFSIIKVPNP